MKPLADCKLYAFVDTAYLHGRAPEVVAQQLCDGGADLIQLRAKTSSPAEIRRMAEAIAPVLRKANVGLVINDHLDIAREVGADLSSRPRRFLRLRLHAYFPTPICQLPTPDWPLDSRLSPSRARHCRRSRLHRHRADLRHGHQADCQTGDARLRPLGGGESERAVVRHRGDQFADH